jgi:hypothetical protein
MEAMKVTQFRHAARRAGLLILGLFLIACSVGLGYVIHVTRQTLHPEASLQSLLPLVVMAIGAAGAGMFLLRFALHRQEEMSGWRFDGE